MVKYDKSLALNMRDANIQYNPFIITRHETKPRTHVIIIYNIRIKSFLCMRIYTYHKGEDYSHIDLSSLMFQCHFHFMFNNTFA